MNPTKCLAVAAMVLSALTASCADDGAPERVDTEGSTGTQTNTDPTSTSTGTTDPTGSGTTSDAIAPQILDIDLIANPLSVLSATVEVETDVATTIAVTMTPEGEEPIDLRFESPSGTRHVYPVLGMRAQTAYEFEVTVEGAQGQTATDGSLTFVTQALPADFPPIEADVAQPGMVQPGVTLFDVFRWTPSADIDFGLVLGLDAEGEVVWYYEDAEQVQDIKPAQDGTLWIMNVPSDLLRRIDMLGNEVFSVSAESLGIDSFHHELLELPNGNIAVLGSELRNITGYEGGTAAYDVVADTIVEISPEGMLVDEINLFDLYDPVDDFIEPFFSNPFWNSQYPEALDGTKDWTHGNALIYDPDEDAYYASLRHLLLVSKISRATGALQWSLGPNRDFMMIGDGAWQYAQHAPELQDDGSMLLYDNGNARPLPMGESNYSRVVRYSIDEEAMEVTQEWAWRAPYYTPIVGDADRLANGNILVTAGGRVDDETLPPGDVDNRKFATIVEITGDENPTVVSTFTVSDESADPTGYTVYRADRVPSLYQLE